MTQYPQPPGGQVGYAPQQPNQGLSIASMIVGIISILTFCVWWLSIPLAVVAVVLAIVARGKIARGEAGGAGMAKAGLITGIIGGVLALIFAALLLAGISMFGNEIQKAIEEQQRQQQQQQTTTTP